MARSSLAAKGFLVVPLVSQRAATFESVLKVMQRPDHRWDQASTAADTAYSSRMETDTRDLPGALHDSRYREAGGRVDERGRLNVVCRQRAEVLGKGQSHAEVVHELERRETPSHEQPPQELARTVPQSWSRAPTELQDAVVEPHAFPLEAQEVMVLEADRNAAEGLSNVVLAQEHVVMLGQRGEARHDVVPGVDALQNTVGEGVDGVQAPSAEVCDAAPARDSSVLTLGDRTDG